MTIQVFDPTTETARRTIEYAARPESLAGLRIGLVDNSKHNSDQILLRVAGLLEREYGAKSHVIRQKKSAGIQPTPEVIAEFKADCDFVVAGVGD